MGIASSTSAHLLALVWTFGDEAVQCDARSHVWIASQSGMVLSLFRSAPHVSSNDVENVVHTEPLWICVVNDNTRARACM